MAEVEDNGTTAPGEYRLGGRESKGKKALYGRGMVREDTKKFTSWLVTVWQDERHGRGLLASKSWTTKCGDLQGS